MLDHGSFGHPCCAGCVDEQELVFEPDGVLDLLVDVAARRSLNGFVQVFRPGNDARGSGQTGTESVERCIFRVEVVNDFLNT